MLPSLLLQSMKMTNLNSLSKLLLYHIVKLQNY